MTLRVTPAEIVAAAEASGRAGLLSKAPHWGRIRLGDVAKVVNGAPFKSTLFNKDGLGMPLVRIRDVGAGELSTWYRGPWDNEQLVQLGDILVGMDGEFRAARWVHGDAVLNQRVCRIEVHSDAYDDRFLLLVLQGYLDAIGKATSSVTVKHLSSRSIAEIPLPLPPIGEQMRIVEVLEDHLSRLDAAHDYLAAAKARANMLLAAHLRGVWNSYRSATRRVDQVGRVVTGTTPPTRGGDPWGGETPFLTPSDIGYGGQVRDWGRTLSEAGRGVARVINGNAVVAVCIGATLGKVGWVDRPVGFNQQVNAIHMNPESGEAEFVAAMMAAPQFQQQMRETASSTTMPILNKSKFSALTVVCPEREVQRAELESIRELRLGVARLNGALESASRRQATLRNTLLEAAFSGRLAATRSA